VTLAEQLQAYLTRTQGRPVTVDGLQRISGGASRETYRYMATSGGETRAYILRRDPPGSLIETDRRLEFEVIRSFPPDGNVPAPVPVALEEDGAELERPFFIMEMIPVGAAGSPFAANAYGEHTAAIGEQFFAIMGRIAAADPMNLPVGKVAEATALDACWKRELDYWEGVIDEDELHPQPIVRAAIRRLRANPPPPAQKLSIVHGDYRSGNFLHDGQGTITGILDWEMAHLGDPFEDFGWGANALWQHNDPTRAAGLIPRDRAIAIWEAESGLKFDERAMAWWDLFASVKGQAIWISSTREFVDSGFREPILAFSGLIPGRRHDEIIAEQLIALEGLA
jgi:aminoglycoside phosphotransferase (APT) family kinase protein